MFIIQMTKNGVSPRIKEIAHPKINAFLKREDHSNRILNMLLDYSCLNFSILDA
jgi:hypothetical protein